MKSCLNCLPLSSCSGGVVGYTAVRVGTQPVEWLEYLMTPTSNLMLCLLPPQHLNPRRPVTPPEGRNRGNHPVHSEEPVCHSVPVSGTPPDATPAGVCCGPSHARWPRSCRQMCCGRWDTLVTHVSFAFCEISSSEERSCLYYCYYLQVRVWRLRCSTRAWVKSTRTSRTSRRGPTGPMRRRWTTVREEVMLFMTIKEQSVIDV